MQVISEDEEDGMTENAMILLSLEALWKTSTHRVRVTMGFNKREKIPRAAARRCDVLEKNSGCTYP